MQQYLFCPLDAQMQKFRDYQYLQEIAQQVRNDKVKHPPF